METNFVDTLSKLQLLIEGLAISPSHGVNLFLDVEGTNLSRDGSVSILTLHDRHHDITHLVDITTLGKDAFTAAFSIEEGSCSLKTILEDPAITKVFFDVRNDSNALFFLFGIRLAGVRDLQLMELATRQFGKRILNGLGKCIDHDAGLSWAGRQEWKTVKEAGLKLFAPDRGGSYAVFDVQPLPDPLKSYCAQDVTFMPTLYQAYCRSLCDFWLSKIEEETNSRISSSQTLGYVPNRRHKALSPTQWVNLSASRSQMMTRGRVIALSWS
jgi:exonuclease 3'-5' domain-containing protein 1